MNATGMYPHPPVGRGIQMVLQKNLKLSLIYFITRNVIEDGCDLSV